jgi:hypothetical protein
MRRKGENKMKNLSALVAALTFLLGNVANAQISGGGNFTLEQSVIAAGGGASAGGGFKVEGTSGQAAAGRRPTAASLQMQNGFWTAAPLAPTAAAVQISGRVTTAGGNGIRNVTVMLTEASGASRAVITGSFGYYSFADITAGQTFIISVTAKRFNFTQPTRVVMVNEEINNLDFIAAEN